MSSVCNDQACGEIHSDYKAKVDGTSVSLGKGKSKKVSLTLLVHPTWMKGAPSGDAAGKFGGSVNDDAVSTSRWFTERSKNLSYIEVRGELPEFVEVPGLGLRLETAKSNIPLKAKFACQEATCGRVQAIVQSIADFGTTAPISPYAQQCYCPECESEGQLYGGRFFQEPNVDAINASCQVPDD